MLHSLGLYSQGVGQHRLAPEAPLIGTCLGMREKFHGTKFSFTNSEADLPERAGLLSGSSPHHPTDFPKVEGGLRRTTSLVGKKAKNPTVN